MTLLLLFWCVLIYTVRVHITYSWFCVLHLHRQCHDSLLFQCLTSVLSVSHITFSWFSVCYTFTNNVMTFAVVSKCVNLHYQSLITYSCFSVCYCYTFTWALRFVLIQFVLHLQLQCHVSYSCSSVCYIKSTVSLVCYICIVSVCVTIHP